MTSPADSPAPAQIQSMTGSGTASGRTALGEVTVEFRSVNGRGLSIKSRFQGECQGLEAATESYIRSRLHRGSVLAAMAVTAPVDSAEPVIDPELAVAIGRELETLAKRIGTTFELRDVLAFPGVIPATNRATSRLSRDLPDDIAGLLAEAVDQLVASREREGGETVIAMHREIDKVEAELAEIAKLAPQIVASYREKLLQRVNEFLAGRATTMEPEDVIREVAVFADRVDITEEQQRLASHMTKARELLGFHGPVGRNLEFLIQEMLREVNTLGSKSPDAAVAHRVVEMKSSIDKLKEQTANLA